MAAVRRRRCTGEDSTWSYGHAELLVALGPRSVPSGGFVNVTGARRRLRALACLGWSVAEIAARLEDVPGTVPVGTSTLDAIRSGRTHAAVRPQFDRAVRAAYDVLSMQPAPSGRSATRAASHAVAKSWLPPLAYDEDQLDDPDPRAESRARKSILLT